MPSETQHGRKSRTFRTGETRALVGSDYTWSQLGNNGTPGANELQ